METSFMDQEKKPIQLNPSDFFHVETPAVKTSPPTSDTEKSGVKKWTVSSALKWWQDKAVDFWDNPNFAGNHKTPGCTQSEVKQELINGKKDFSEESESKNAETVPSEEVNTMDFLFKQVLDFLSLMSRNNSEHLQTSILSGVQSQKIFDPKILVGIMTKMEEEKHHLISEYQQNIEDLRVNIEGVRALVECREDSRSKLELELKKTRLELEKKTKVTTMFAEDYVILQGIASRLLSGESKDSVLQEMTPHIRSFISCLDSTHKSTLNSTIDLPSSSSTTSQTISNTGNFTQRNKLNLMEGDGELTSEEDKEQNHTKSPIKEKRGSHPLPAKAASRKRQKTGEKQQNGTTGSSSQTTQSSSNGNADDSSNNNKNHKNNGGSKKQSNEVWASEVLFSLSKSDFPSGNNSNNNNNNTTTDNNNTSTNTDTNSNAYSTDDTPTITRAQLELILARESLNKRANGNNLQLDDEEKSGRGKKRRGKLPEAATDVLKKWLFEHYYHPYPTEEEKAALATQTNLSLNQINNWFTNARRRILPKQKLFEQGSPPQLLAITNGPSNETIINETIAHNDTNNSNSNNSSPIRREEEHSSPLQDYNSPATSKVPIPQRHSTPSPISS
eukprot:TRINITY_DN1957_c0_g2_i1.p1 TRINITY_DN1957_c0_g2~~TRINITY_DN1957_c0_g2_i1.p1  ORF type:complete len:616 (+),score=159.07 TRINITY_DN1957_c0_g2_i1:552-2399(+)